MMMEGESLLFFSLSWVYELLFYELKTMFGILFQWLGL